jgi:hypothetical protein
MLKNLRRWFQRVRNIQVLSIQRNATFFVSTLEAKMVSYIITNITSITVLETFTYSSKEYSFEERVNML